jgi:hypothetical protein
MGVDEENKLHLATVRKEQGDAVSSCDTSIAVCIDVQWHIQAAESSHNQTTLKKLFDSVLSNARVLQQVRLHIL